MTAWKVENVLKKYARVSSVHFWRKYLQPSPACTFYVLFPDCSWLFINFNFFFYKSACKAPRAECSTKALMKFITVM